SYVSRLGDATYGDAVPRWRSTLTLDWNRGPWGATLAQVYSAGYIEPVQEPATGTRQVGAAASWDLQGRYTGFKGWQLAAGVRNLFDEEPPFRVQGDTFQIGYNPQVANPLLRLFYLSATYTWK
ncbi:MAG: TonB-dependent receptor domain-containing protein, partial [Burkholderiaceae bacterium]